MTLAVTVLVFLSISLFGLWMTLRGEQTARRRLEQDLIKARIARLKQVDELNDTALLRDETYSGFAPLDRLLNSMRLASNLRKLLVQADIRMRVGTLLLLMGVLAVLGFWAAGEANLGLFFSLVAGVLLGSVPYTYVAVMRKKRFARFEAQFPEAVDLMSRAIRAGHAFTTGIKMVGDEMPDPVGQEFRRMFEEQNLGMPLRNAMLGMLDRIELVDLKLFVVAVLIQRQSGGNLSEILDKIALTIRERFRILRQLKVHTAQARLTGIILTALPPVVGVLIYILNYEYMRIIFVESWGLRVLAASVLLQILGFLWIRKIVNIEV